MFRIATFTLLLTLIQMGIKAQVVTIGPPTFDFSRLIYHSSHCNGTCPQIDMQIDSNRNILLHREVWSKKGETDKTASGYFKGRLDVATYSELEHFLFNSGYYNWKWPKVFCCDLPLTTIIVYVHGERTHLTSMTPSDEAKAFIDYLLDFAMTVNIPRTDQRLEIEK